MAEYEKIALEKLLDKYRKKVLNNEPINRKISIKPKDLYKKYDDNDASIEILDEVDEACKKIEEMEFVALEQIPHGERLLKITLNTENVCEIEKYMKKEWQINSRDSDLEKLDYIYEQFSGRGELTEFYLEKEKKVIVENISLPDSKREKEILCVLDFIQSNKEDLYIREVAMLVFGTSKLLDIGNGLLENVCSIIREYKGIVFEDGDQIDSVLADYNIHNAEQDILIKGPVKIQINGAIFDVGKLNSGLSLQSGDIDNIESVQIEANNFMTVENKTAFYRCNDDNSAYMYLGGYANRHQIRFLKKVIEENLNCIYKHFGDIDAGGFFIHRRLCKLTGVEFVQYNMGVEQLKNEKYKNCIVEISENDKNRLTTLLEDERYKECVRFMLDNNCKLEQEIVALRK